MTRTHNHHRPPSCGECSLFKHEDTDGYGYCNVIGYERRCDFPCYFAAFDITAKDAVKILHHHQKWRRGGKGNMIAPWLVGAAIDVAIHELRKEKRKNKN